MAVSLSILGCGHIRPQRNWRMRRHAHADHHELILVLGGQIRTEISGRVLHGRRGDVLFYPAGSAHQEQAVGAAPLETLFLAFRANPRTVSDWPLLGQDMHGRIEMLCRWMLELQPARTAPDRRILRDLCRAVVYEYGRCAQPSEDQLALRTGRYMRTHLAEKVTLDVLAAQAGLSRFHFARLFRQAAGVSPMRFLTQLRVEAAATLLRQTPLAAKAIATQVGFADEHHFSRVFRRVYGDPPGSLRPRRAAATPATKRRS